MIKLNTFYGAVALVAGTSIGGAILSLPVSTASYGFVPAVFLIFVCWLFMTYSALLLLEVNSGCESSANLISMARKTLGWPGVLLTWTSYLLLLYALMVAYLSGLSATLVDILKDVWGISMPVGVAVAVLVGCFGSLIYAGTRLLDGMNRVLMVALALSFIMIVGGIFCYGNLHPVSLSTDHRVWHASGTVITSFGFSIIVPSLRRYCGSSALRVLPKAIVWGSVLPLMAYVCWEFAMLAEIPMHGPLGLLHIRATGQPATGLVHALTSLLHVSWFGPVLRVFMLAIITTSLVGVALSLFDCLRDGCRLSEGCSGRFWAIMLTMLPPAVFSVWDSSAFMSALEYGSLFVIILLGLMPAIMAYRARAQLSTQPQAARAGAIYKAPGGQWALAISLIFFLVILAVDVSVVLRQG